MLTRQLWHALSKCSVATPRFTYTIAASKVKRLKDLQALAVRKRAQTATMSARPVVHGVVFGAITVPNRNVRQVCSHDAAGRSAVPRSLAPVANGEVCAQRGQGRAAIHKQRHIKERGCCADMDGTLTVPCIDFAEMRCACSFPAALPTPAMSVLLARCTTKKPHVLRRQRDWQAALILALASQEACGYS